MGFTSGGAGGVALRPATLAEWERAYAASPRATFFHGPRWSRLWEAYTGGASRPAPLHATLPGGATAVLGATRVAGRAPGLARRHVSPEGCAGGWVSADALPPPVGAALARAALRVDGLLWRLGAADADVQAVAPPCDREELTHVLDLREGPDALVARWRSTARGAASRAERAGVRVRLAGSEADWDRYRALTDAVVGAHDDRQGYGATLFPLVREHAGDEARLWLAELDGRAIAAALMFVHGRTAVGWHACFLPDVPGAPNLIQREALGALHAEGVELYDLLGSGAREGVIRWKESLGAVRHPVLAYDRRSRVERTLRRLLRRPAAPTRPGSAA